MDDGRHEPNESDSSSEGNARPPEEAPNSLEERIEGWIRTMLSESMLGPLFAVILGHAVAFLIPVIVLALRDRNLAALGALAILLVGSGGALRRDWQLYRRPGPIGGTLLVVWSLGFAVSYAAAHYGFC